VRHRRQGRALGHSVDQAWCAAPAARMGPPLTESPGRCRVDERRSCGEPHGGHHAARCASCARAQGLAGTVRGIRCRHGVLLRRCASGAPSRHRGDAAGKGRASHCCPLNMDGYMDDSARSRRRSFWRSRPFAPPVRDGNFGGRHEAGNDCDACNARLLREDGAGQEPSGAHSGNRDAGHGQGRMRSARRKAPDQAALGAGS
jgi:hypothetical protein